MMKIQFSHLLLCVCLSMASPTWADKEYTLTLPDKPVPMEGHIRQGTSVSPSGHTLSLNSLCYLRDGEPWYPVMGEMHYARVPRGDWDEEVLKMKASGVTVVATYVFWIYHEETENEYVWESDRDLRHFLAVCQRQGMYVWLRIGPWCHGEVRNGGFPDWLMGLEGGLRQENPLYLRHVERFFSEIGKQAEGFCFKDGGPVIGVQIENEYGFDTPPRLEHLLHLKQLAVEAGLDVPYYTATGWPRSDLRQTELIPVWGGYPEAPWDSRVTEIPLSANYLFTPVANDPSIGKDLLGEQENAIASAFPYPYSTAEMGGGNQATYHRRPVITAADVVAQSYVKVGSGANMMGYYMYRGGHNPMGRRSTLQESKATGYPNDYPVLNYDFFAPVGEWGQVRSSYYDLKVLHAFLNDYGAHLAATVPTLPEGPAIAADDKETLRLSVRSDGASGYVFINNYQRLSEMNEQKGVCLRIRRQDGTETVFPKFDVAPGEQLIFPFHLNLGGHGLEYATAQPLCVLHNATPTYVFFSRNRVVEWAFVADATAGVSLDGQPVLPENGRYRVACSPDTAHLLRLESPDGKPTEVLVLTVEQAWMSWKEQQADGQEFLCITSSQLVLSDGTMTLHNVDDPCFDLRVFPENVSWPMADAAVQSGKEGLFRMFHWEVPEVTLSAVCQTESHPESFVPAQPLYPEDDRKEDPPASCPGPQYFVNFQPVPSSLYYTLDVPALPTSVAGAYVAVDYAGDTASLYADGGLAADDYYTGEPLLFKLDGRRMPDNRRYLLQVIPFAPQVAVYLSPAAREKLQSSPQGVRSVRVLPIYEVKLNLCE